MATFCPSLVVVRGLHSSLSPQKGTRTQRKNCQPFRSRARSSPPFLDKQPASNHSQQVTSSDPSKQASNQPPTNNALHYNKVRPQLLFNCCRSVTTVAIHRIANYPQTWNSYMFLSISLSTWPTTILTIQLNISTFIYTNITVRTSCVLLNMYNTYSGLPRTQPLLGLWLCPTAAAVSLSQPLIPAAAPTTVAEGRPKEIARLLPPHHYTKVNTYCRPSTTAFTSASVSPSECC